MTETHDSARGPADEALGSERAKAGRLLATAEVGFLAVNADDGPYVVPISFAYDGADIYFHGGDGMKATALEADPRASLAVTSDVGLIVKGDGACAVNFDAHSVVVRGRVTRIEPAFEKDAALRTLVAKYHPDAAAAPLPDGKVAKTLVYRMSVESIGYRELPGD